MKKSHQKSSNDLYSHQLGKLVAIVGPTASGKSSLAIKTAQLINAEIVCADSVTAYRGLTVGSAKPSEGDRALIKHHLLDICDPTHRLTVAEYAELAREAMQDIWSRDKTPLIVGGSGLYIDALLYGYNFSSSSTTSLPVDPNDFNDLSLEELQSRAEQSYPGRLNDSDSQNRRRLVRLLERGELPPQDRSQRSYDCHIIGLDPDDDVLKSTINTRTHQMIADGFVSEVQQLIATYGEDIACLQSVGYRQVVDYINGPDSSIDRLVDAINRASWQLARKQRSWFRRSEDISWVEDTVAALTVLRKNGYNV